jgi:hypothetical protein
VMMGMVMAMGMMVQVMKMKVKYNLIISTNAKHRSYAPCFK